MKTVTHLFARRLALTLLALFINTMAWASILDNGNYTQEEYGGYTFYKDDSNNYLIRNVADWNGLADVVAAGNNCLNKTFKMMADIGTTEAPITKTIGRQTGGKKTDRKRFVGTFDGGGHTLTIALNTTDDWWQYNQTYCAPFAYTKDATIKNLHVAGTITTSNQFSSGLVGSTGDGGVGTCTIDNCHVSVAITTTYISTNGKYANHGGFIGIAEGNATVTNSWFDGKLLGSDYEYSSGFMGMNKGKNTIVKNCLFNPSEIQDGMDITGSWELVHSLNGGVDSISDCYWVKQFGELGHVQGQKVFAAEPDPTLYTYTTVTAADHNTYYIVTSNLSWSTIQEALNIDGATYNLPTSFKAGSSDAALEVPTGASVTLNMGDHIIDRGLALEAAQDNGYVIRVNSGATLTLNGGTITGGHNTSHGGGIYNEGTLIINGTTITGNTSAGHGAGIYNAGTLNMNDAVVTGNAGKQYNNKGLGVYVVSGDFNIQGNVQIHDNYYTYSNPTQVQVAHNTYLAGSTVINIVDKLVAESSIGIDGEETIPMRVITTNLEGNGSLKGNFTLDDHRNFALYNTNGEIKLNAALAIGVTGYGEKNGNWVFIASPVVGSIAPTAVANLKPSSANGYDLYRLNPNDEKWENYKSSAEHPDFNLVNGQGYLYANKNTVKLTFLGDYREDGSVEIELQEGWNLVGNPFPKKAYVGRAFYKMNDDGTDIVPVIENFSDYTSTQINVCTGIIVKAKSSSETVTFSTSAPSESSPNQGDLKIALTQANTRDNSMLDMAIVSFNEGVELGKFYFGEHDASIFFTKGGEEYAVASCDKHDEMPVNFKASENGEYALAVNVEDTEMNYLHLIDNKAGLDVDLLQTPSYRFEANTMDYPSRFRLVFSAQSSDEEAADEFAFVSNGEIVFNGEGQVQIFDMTGRTIGTHKAGSRVAISEMTAGVYVLRLTNGETVRNQKIVIR